MVSNRHAQSHIDGNRRDAQRCRDAAARETDATKARQFRATASFRERLASAIEREAAT